jgi:hypothetical protein
LVVLELHLCDVLARGMGLRVEPAAQRRVVRHPLHLDAQELAGRIARVLDFVDFLDGAGQADRARHRGRTADHAVAEPDVLEEHGPGVVQVDVRRGRRRVVMGGQLRVGGVAHVHDAHPVVVQIQAVAVGQGLDGILGPDRRGQAEDGQTRVTAGRVARRVSSLPPAVETDGRLERTQPNSR